MGYEKRIKMSQEERAKQFLPFSAVRGLEEALERKRQELFVTSNGFGNAKIKCQDGYLHTDEISISPDEIKLRGYLFNHSPTEKVKEFKKDIEKAVEKFYGI